MFEWKTETGCRPAQLIGVWSMEPLSFEVLHEQAMHVLVSEQYEIVARQSREMVEAERAEPYQVDENGIAHFSVTGPLTRNPTSMQAVTGGTSTLLFQRALRQAAVDTKVRGALVHVDSPGGHSSVQADVGSAIRSFRQSKPIAGHINGQGCSAAYGLLAECDHINADPAAIVGSIGTMMLLRDTSELMKRTGVKPIAIATGDRKAAIMPGIPVSDDTVKYLEQVVSDAGESFRKQVKERRPKITPDAMKDILRGGVYSGESALKIGLVDSLSDTDGAVASFAQRIPFHGGRMLPGKVPSFF